MPIYEFRCLECKRISEIYRRMAGSGQPAKCKHCGGRATKVPFSSSGLAVHPPDTITTNFGRTHGGHKPYSREQYKEMCKKLDRDPCGLLWQHKAPVGQRKPK